MHIEAIKSNHGVDIDFDVWADKKWLFNTRKDDAWVTEANLNSMASWWNICSHSISLSWMTFDCETKLLKFTDAGVQIMKDWVEVIPDPDQEMVCSQPTVPSN